MLKRIRIRNFRSIIDTEVKFADSGLTVLIGANGSGKSNFIRALDFLGMVARDGLDPALYSQRSRDALIPKALSPQSVPEASTTFAYEFEVGRPEWYPSSAP